MSTPAAEIVKLRTQLRNYYSKFQDFGDGLSVSTDFGGTQENEYYFGVSICLVTPEGELILLANRTVFWTIERPLDLELLINTLNEDINRRLYQAHQIAKSCPERLGEKTHD